MYSVGYNVMLWFINKITHKQVRDMCRLSLKISLVNAIEYGKVIACRLITLLIQMN